MTNNVAENLSATEAGDNVSVSADSRILRLLAKSDQKSSGSHGVQFNL